MKNARQTSKNPFYAVSQVPLVTSDGYTTPYLANVRQDTKEVLGICSEQYQLVDNEELVSKAEDAMNRCHLPTFNRRFRILEGGAKFFAEYDFFGHNQNHPHILPRSLK